MALGELGERCIYSASVHAAAKTRAYGLATCPESCKT